MSDYERYVEVVILGYQDYCDRHVCRDTLGRPAVAAKLRNWLGEIEELALPGQAKQAAQWQFDAWLEVCRREGVAS